VQVEIRRAVPGDEAALSLVAQASFLETYAHMIPRQDMLAFCADEHGAARYAGWLADGTRSLWIAEAAETGAPVGYAVVTPPDLPVATQDDDLELKRIYALHRLHGSGLGPRLMACAVEGAGAAGARRLLVGVHGGNARALAFYARQGFTQAGVRRFRVGQSVFDDLILARAIGGPAT
jgi:ribosomal protein S18 acetylase RimI-like enzyme